MHFKRKIVCSMIVASMLASCATEDKHKASPCVDGCPLNPVITATPGGTPEPSETLVSLDYSKRSETVTWQKKHSDEQVEGLVLASQNALIYSKWDNRLIIVDMDTKSIIKDELFLDITGGRYVSGETTVTDAQTGASEQVLLKMLSEQSGTKVFSMLGKDDHAKVEIGIGIYSDTIVSDVPDGRFGRRNTSDVDYYHYPKIEDMALSHSGTTLAACGDDRKILIFDANVLNAPQVIDTGKKMRSVSFSANDEYIFAGSGGLSGLIRIYNTTSKEILSEIKVKETPRAIVELENTNKIIVIFNGSSIVRIYDIADVANPKLDKTLVINGNAISISTSPDNKLFAIAGTGNNVNLFSIEGGDAPKVIKVAAPVSTATFTADKELVIVDDLSMDFYDITVTP